MRRYNQQQQPQRVGAASAPTSPDNNKDNTRDVVAGWVMVALLLFLFSNKDGCTCNAWMLKNQK
jgi:hypothetical protein